MPPPNNSQPPILDQSKALAGVLALLAADREERVAADKTKTLGRTEVVLARGGLAAPEIARLPNKPEAGVRKAIQRGRAPKKASTKKASSKRAA